MPLIDANYSAGTGARYSLAAGDDLRIARGVAVWSTDLYGVQSAVGGHTVSIDGALFGLRGGVSLTGNSNTITIGKTGYVMSELRSDINIWAEAIALTGYNQTIVNHGQIIGRVGILLNLTGGFASGETSRIENDGRIFGQQVGVKLLNGSTQGLFFENSGVLAGRTAAFNAELSGQVYFVNNGIVRGDIFLGSGDVGGEPNLYDGRGGTIFSFTASLPKVFGGGGDDLFRPGASAEYFAGISGVDTVEFISSASIKVSLVSPTFGTGFAKGDIFNGIEVLIGSLNGADHLIGALDHETLRGLGGRDTLTGLTGNDTLFGGAGIDLLTGSAGNDVFAFNLDHIGDVITDFSSAGTAGDDEIWISDSFGGGLQLGVLDASQFVVSTTNRAKDLSDRFILRTTDKTLWFDPDGLGGGAPRLVADLQQTATMTASDIRIVDI